MRTALIEEPSFGAVLCARVTETTSSAPHAAFACQVPSVCISGDQRAKALILVHEETQHPVPNNG